MKLFKGKINANKAFDTIANGIDKLAFTNEERAELNIKLADKVAEYSKETLSENTHRSKTRRFASICIISIYLILVLTLVVLSFFENINTDIIKELVSDSPLTTGFIMVLAFFYGGYYLKRIGFKGKNNK